VASAALKIPAFRRLGIFVTQMVTEFGLVISAIAVLSLCGAGIVAPFRGVIPFTALAAPQAGLLALTTATLAAWSVLHLPIGAAALIGVATCIAFSATVLAAQRYVPSGRDLVASGLFIFSVAVVAVAINCLAAAQHGAPALLYADGTDHLGYAHMADWLRWHAPANVMPYEAEPRADPAIPYQSMPNLMIGGDPRIGAFAFLAMIGVLANVPSSFAYDTASAIALTAGVAGVAAVFARRWSIYALLVVGLAMSHWYEFLHAGFLGKALAYPAALFLVGLFLARAGDRRAGILALLCVVAVGSALMLSGYVTALVLTIVGLVWIALESLRSRRFDIEEFASLALIAAVAVLASGFFVRPYFGGFPGSPYGILETVLRGLDLQGWSAAVTFEPWSATTLVVVSVSLPLVLGIIAVARRNSTAAALLLAPLLLLAALTAGHLYSVVLQLTGFFYAVSLCGAATLLSTSRESRGSLAIGVACGVALIAMRVPHALASLERYTNPEFIGRHTLALSDFDAIERVAAGRPILVDVVEPQLAVAVLVELGRRGMDLQWTETSWFHAVGNWRCWAVPTYEQAAPFRLVRAEGAYGPALVRTPLLALINNAESSPIEPPDPVLARSRCQVFHHSN
jgi:hypothetical protein